MIGEYQMCRPALKRILVSLLFAVLGTLLPVSGLTGETKKDWQFLIEPYMMAPYIQGDTSLHVSNNANLNITGADVDITPSDIFDNLEKGGMIHIEAILRNSYGIIFDFSFMDLEMEDDLPRPATGAFAAGVKQTVFELHGFKRFRVNGWDLDVFAGLRRWKNKIHAVKRPGLIGEISRQRDENWVDAVVGARAFYDLTEDWRLMLRADIGGFGLESDFTSKLAVGISYRVTEMIALDIQYNALWVDFDSGNFNTPGYFAYDTVTHGPAIGIIFNL